ncbi:MAG: antibiotic biosynthesis monooxygenase [Proteobacteria bacterium]|nr:antibiotic biosynthesis monooxygenase [Pseudomonadota bacterium]
MIIVIGKILLHPGRSSEFERALNTLLPNARRDDGCISYDFSRDFENPDLVRFVERWSDMPALDAHNAQPHLVEFQAAIRQYLAEPPEIFIYEAADRRTP